jgi:hypothetical protein
MIHPDEDFDPAAALAEIDDARMAPLARMATISWRYDVIYALLGGLLVAVQSLPVPLAAAGDALVVCGLLALMRWHKVRTGVWINGLAPGRARWVALGVGVMAAIAAIFVLILAHSGHAWVGLPAGLVMSVAALGASRLWRRVFHDEIAAGSMPTALGSGRLGLGGGLWLIAGFGAVACIVGATLAAYHVSDFSAGVTLGVGAGLLLTAPLIWIVKRLRA